MFDFIKYLQKNRLTLTDRMADRAKHNSIGGKKLVKEEYNPEVPDADQRIGSSDKTASRVGGNQSKLADLKRKKDELVKKFTSGQIDIQQYKQMIGNIPQQIKALQAALDKETMPIGDDEEDSLYEGVEDFNDFMFQSRKNSVRTSDLNSFIQQMEKLGFEVDPTASAPRDWAVGLPIFRGINGPMKDPNGKSIYYADQETTDRYANEGEINEIEVTPESDLGQSVQQLAKLNEQIEKLSVEMKKLESQHKELEGPIYSILQDLSTLGEDVDKSIKVGNQLIVSFKTKPTEVTNYKYKEAFTYLEGKVNGALKKLVNEIKEAHKTISPRKGSISVTKLDEADSLASKLDIAASKFSDDVDSIHNIVAKLTGGKTM